MSLHGEIPSEEESPLEAFKSLLENTETILWYAEERPYNLNWRYKVYLILYLVLLLPFIGLIAIILNPGENFWLFPVILGIIMFLLYQAIFWKIRASFQYFYQWYSPQELAHYAPAAAITARHLFMKRYIPYGNFSKKLNLIDLTRIKDIEIWNVDAISEIKAFPFGKNTILLSFMFPVMITPSTRAIFSPPQVRIPISDADQFTRIMSGVRPGLRIKLFNPERATVFGQKFVTEQSKKKPKDQYERTRVNETTATLYNLGITRHEQKDFARAAEAFEKALSIDPTYIAAWTYLGVVRNDQKDYTGAAEACEKALAIDPKYTAAWISLAIARDKKGNFAGAAEACEKALAIDSKLAVAWNTLGNIRNDQQDFAGATEALEKSLSFDSKLAAAWVNLGIARLGKGDSTGTAEACEKALAINPKDVTAWIYLGITRYIRKDFDGATEAYKQAITIDPNQEDAWTNLGIVRIAQRDLAGALKACEKALAINMELAAAWNTLGIIKRELGDLDGSAKAFEKAIAIGDNKLKSNPSSI